MIVLSVGIQNCEQNGIVFESGIFPFVIGIANSLALSFLSRILLSLELESVSDISNYDVLDISTSTSSSNKILNNSLLFRWFRGCGLERGLHNGGAR